MVEAMKKIAVPGSQLDLEERNLLSVAYKNVVGSRRASWRIVSSIEQKEESKGTVDDKVEIARKYRNQVRKTSMSLCCFELCASLQPVPFPLLILFCYNCRNCNFVIIDRKRVKDCLQ